MRVIARKRFPENAKKKKAADAGYRKHGPGERTPPVHVFGEAQEKRGYGDKFRRTRLQETRDSGEYRLLALAVLATVSVLSSGGSGGRREVRSTFVS